MFKKIIGLVLLLGVSACGADDVERPKFGGEKGVAQTNYNTDEDTCSAISATEMLCLSGVVVPLPATFPYNPDCNNCLVKVTNSIATVNCPNGIHFSFPVVQGPQGNPGLPGTNGTNGQNGAVGQTGAVGHDGTNGSSCSTSKNIDGDTIISCTDGSVQVIKSTCNDCYSFGARGNVFTLPTNTTTMPNYSAMTAEESVKVDTFDVYNRQSSLGYPGLPSRQTYFGIRYEGYILVPACPASLCYYRLTSDDGAIFSVDGTVVVNHDGLNSPSSKTGSVSAAPGWHKYRLDYFQGPASQIALALEVSTDNGSTYRQVDTSELKFKVQ